MTPLTYLKSASSLRDVALILGYKASSLSYILYKLPSAYKYTQFEIPKRSGGTRIIKAPGQELKILQRKLAYLLEQCIAELNATYHYNDQFAHGFKKGKSIFSNAKPHRKKRWVFNVDIENFFGSINFGRVRGFFMKDRRFALNGNVATVLAQIACVDNSLPQGSPCSPIISNLIGHVLDVHLVKLASRNGCHYSRYADDLTFSTNLSQFPPAIAHTLPGNSDVWVPGSDLTKLMSRTSFAINQQKTRMQFKNSRQDVTGLVVNKKINVKSDYRRTVRAMVHSLLTHGSFERISSADDGKGGRMLVKMPGTTAELHGMLGFIDSVEHYNKVLAIPAGGIVSEKRKSKDANPPRKELTGKELLYRRFLLYKEFFAMDKPVILCEGETDNVYLTHAIRSLASRFQLLATVPKPGEIKIRPRIFKYVETSTGRILGLGGGTGDLANLIRAYFEELQRFVPPDSQHPFLIIIDNDTGAKGNGKPLHVIKNIAGIEINRTAPFTHISGNLYLVLTPIQGDLEESAIEDLFPAGTLNTKIDGKGFWWKKAAPPNDKYDSTKHYGKKVFAHKVVRPNADSIDFNGFSTLLANITLAFEDFYRKHAASKSNKPISGTANIASLTTL